MSNIEKNVLVTKKNLGGLVTVNCPDKSNAVSPELMRRTAEVLADLASESYGASGDGYSCGQALARIGGEN